MYDFMCMQLEGFRKTLMQSLQEDDGSTVSPFSLRTYKSKAYF